MQAVRVHCQMHFLTKARSSAASVLAGAQGGTCLVIGDDHAWVAEASRLAQERINCTLLPLQPFYRREGHHQACLLCCQLSTVAAITMSWPLLS